MKFCALLISMRNFMLNLNLGSEKLNVNFLVNLLNMIIKSINYAKELEYTFKFRFSLNYSNRSNNIWNIKYVYTVEFLQFCTLNAYFSIHI